MDESLNKYISNSGYCSRRKADEYIEQGRVSINGVTATKGNRVKPGDVVEVDFERIKANTNIVYIALNKPKGITCTTDVREKTNIVSYVNYKQRIFPVGRLDKLSEGLIFLTNDGDIVNKILRAGNQHEKEYKVTVDKAIDAAFLDRMRNGVKIAGVSTRKCAVTQTGKSSFKIILKQGMNRQIRRMCEALEYRVVSLTRIRIMSFTVSGIAPGMWRFFTPDEVAKLNHLLVGSSNSDSRMATDDGMNE